MDAEYDFPGLISNSIIDYSETNLDNFPSILNSLKKLGCQDIQIRSAEPIPFRKLQLIEKELSNFPLNSIELIVKKNIDDFRQILNFCNTTNLNLRSIIFHSGDIDKFHSINKQLPTILEIKEIFHGEISCGQISQQNFILNRDFYFESKHHNSCLNRKISIDKNGNIKNCPSMKQGFGNINSTTLEKAVQTKGFKKYWNINKDKINVCRDCEFRNICTDCRGYLEDPNNIYSKPLKCGYDPYTNKWEDWSSNPLKKNAISFYNLEEILKGT